MAKLKKILPGLNYLSVYLIILIFFNILLLNIPLTKVFGYEFSAVNSILMFLMTGFYTISLLKLSVASEISHLRFFRRLFLVYFVFLIIPMLISISNSILTINCSMKDGFEFYSVLALPAVAVGTFFAALSFSLQKRFSGFLFIVFFIVVFSVPFLEFYFNPQIYFYNPIFGFFPGTIYDEGLSVTARLLIYRILNLLFFSTAGSLLLFSILKNKKYIKLLTITFSLIIAALFYYFSPAMGFTTTFGSLEHKLGGKIVTKHFNIYYPQKMEKKKVEAMILYHEYYYDRLSNFFGFDYKGRINSFVFWDNSQKKELFGTGSADVAKPWLKSTFISKEDFDVTLRHEIAHCYAGGFGTGILKVAAGLNPFLIEGTAVAAAPQYDENDIDYMAALAYSHGYNVNIQSMLKGFAFYTNVASTAYIYAGAFVKFMVDKYGIDKFKMLYGGGDFFKVYGIRVIDAEREFYAYLKAYGETGSKQQANYYFGRSTIFSKLCPRFVYDRLQNAWDDYNQNNFNAAKDLFYEILKKTDNYSALVGYSESLAKLNRIDSAVKIISNRIAKFKNSGSYYNLELRQADLTALKGDFTSADSIYQNLVSQNPSRTLFYLANLRIAFMRDTSDLIQYIEGSEFDKYLILKKLNTKEYLYSSFPVMINLSNALGESYRIFLKNFGKTLETNNYLGSFAAYKLSQFMLDNLDYSGARRIASLSLRHHEDKNFSLILRENNDKCEWIFKNHAMVLDSSHFLTIK